MKKKRRLKKPILYLILILFLVLLITSSYQIYKWVKDQTKYVKIEEKLEDYVEVDDKIVIPKLTINFDELKKMNSDTIAYLYVKNTQVSYPVVKTSDNDYYLNHTFNKTKNDSGWIFMDYRNTLDSNEKNIIIYGHNRVNGTMFGSLKDTLKKEWYENKDNLIVQLYTEKETFQYQIFSIYRTESEDYYIKTNFNDDYDEFVNKLQSRSDVKIDTDIKDTKQILTLSTCIGYGDDRLVLHAKLIDSKK